MLPASSHFISSTSPLLPVHRVFGLGFSSSSVESLSLLTRLDFSSVESRSLLTRLDFISVESLFPPTTTDLHDTPLITHLQFTESIRGLC